MALHTQLYLSANQVWSEVKNLFGCKAPKYFGAPLFRGIRQIVNPCGVDVEVTQLNFRVPVQTYVH